MDDNTHPGDVRGGASLSHLSYWQRVRAILASSRTPTERLILIAIADHLGDDGRCWPSSSRIASMVGMKRETVSRNITRLTVEYEHPVSSPRRSADGQHRPSSPRWSAMAMRMSRSVGVRELPRMARTRCQ